MKKIISKYKEQYYPTYIWGVVNSGVTSFLWLLIQIQDRIKMETLTKAKFDLFSPTLLKLFIALLIASPLVAIVNFILTVKKRATKALKAKLKSNYLVEFSSYDELTEVVKLGGYLVGDSHIDLATLKRRFSVNPNIVTMLYKNTNGSCGELIGYYILYPLNQTGYMEIMSLNSINGRSIDDTHISRSFNEAVALYIGMAGGVDGTCQRICN